MSLYVSAADYPTLPYKNLNQFWDTGEASKPSDQKFPRMSKTVKKRLLILAGSLVVWASVMLTLGALWLHQNPRGIRPVDGAFSCLSNCKYLATAIEMYSSDFHQPPAHLSQLVDGRYLKLIPTCSVAGLDTYSQTYQPVGQEWTLNCGGAYHTGVHPDETGNVTLESNYPMVGSHYPASLNSKIAP